MTMVKAINNALDIKLKEDSTVVIYGEDVGVEGGVFRVTEGCIKNMAWNVWFDSPLAESGIVGTALEWPSPVSVQLWNCSLKDLPFLPLPDSIERIKEYKNRSRVSSTCPWLYVSHYGWDQCTGASF